MPKRSPGAPRARLSYEAAKRGEIPTIRVGRLLLVPVAPLERLFAGRARVRPARKRKTRETATAATAV
jgi:hypothetical protein